ncbi:MAG: HIT domain-containing protein [Candidatus Moranbacteria bacterium]|nr:HIT domain-containing protein [Candidatus Moranbacteria bacterium]
MRILDKKRATYKKVYTDDDSCVFCRKDEHECDGLSGRYWRVMANKFPYMDGNVMIVSKRHVGKVEEITKKEWEEFGKILSNTQKVLGEIFKTNSFNVGLNVGPESGASIEHLHWQVIPRKFKNITVMNTFADLYLVAVSAEETKKMIDAITKKSKLNLKK